MGGSVPQFFRERGMPFDGAGPRFARPPGQQPPFPEGATPPAQGPGGPRLPPYPGGPPGPQPHMFPQAPGSTQSPGPGMDQTRVPFQAGMPPFQPAGSGMGMPGS